MDNNIYKWIRRKNMTQADLAQTVDVKREYINRIINRKVTPIVSLGIRLANALVVAMEGLFIIIMLVKEHYINRKRCRTQKGEKMWQAIVEIVKAVLARQDFSIWGIGFLVLCLGAAAALIIWAWRGG